MGAGRSSFLIAQPWHLDRGTRKVLATRRLPTRAWTWLRHSRLRARILAGDQATVFGRLVGTWDVEYTDFSKDGKVIHRSGELIVGWARGRGRHTGPLDRRSVGYALAKREVHTDVRYFDPKSRTWPAIFIDPEHASFARFTGAGGRPSDQLETLDFC